MEGIKVYHKSLATGGSDVWETPPWLFLGLERNLGKFDLDAAASSTNALCNKFITEEDNSLICPWEGHVFCNPPYSKLREFCGKAYKESIDPSSLITSVVFLIPARVDTIAWHTFIFNKASQVWFIEGRLKLYQNGKEAKDSAGFPSAVIEWINIKDRLRNITRYKTITKEVLIKWKRQEKTNATRN